jgi:hypothetical protein
VVKLVAVAPLLMKRMASLPRAWVFVVADEEVYYASVVLKEAKYELRVLARTKQLLFLGCVGMQEEKADATPVLRVIPPLVS